MAAQDGSAGADGGPRGPLHFRERNPLYALFLSPRLEQADPVGDGRWSVRIGLAYSNIFEWSESPRHHQYFDLERLSSSFGVAYGISDRWQVGAELGIQANWGGFLDPVVRGYHGLLSLEDSGRKRFGDNAFGLWLVRDGRTELNTPSGAHLDDLRLHVQQLLLGGPGADRSLALRVEAKLPTGSPAVGTGNADVGVVLLARRSWRPYSVHGSLGVVTLHAPAGWGPFVREAGLVYGLAAEREVGSRVSLVAQLSGTSPYVGGFGVAQLDHIPLNLVLGAVGEVRLGGVPWGWEVGFAEDIVPNGPAVDFSLHLEVQRGF